MNKQKNFTELRPHQMGSVFKDIADTYSTLQQTIQELIQNSIDVNARHVQVLINSRIRLVYVSDDGDGATRAVFDEALRSILKSSKSKDKFGRFGRGTLSPLTKCNQFTFQSRGKTGLPHRWTFHCKEVLSATDYPQIPVEVLHPPKEKQWWRTQIMMKGVAFNDAVKYRVNLEELKSAILSSFSTKMRTLGTVVKLMHIDANGKNEEMVFSAQSYEGKALPIWESKAVTPAGKVTVKLYRAQGSSPIPITIGQIDDPFRLDWKQFYASVSAFKARNKKVTPEGEINALFRSGILTGEIECENIKIHPDRLKFERDDALDYFILILNDWFDQVGKQIHAEAEIRAQSSLHQKIAVQAAKLIEGHPLIDRFLKAVKFGSIGKGHASVNAKPVGETNAENATRGGNKGKGTHDPDAKPSVNNPPDKKVTRPGHVPITVEGQDSPKRVIVRGESKGIRIEVVGFPGLSGSDAPLFRVDPEHGLISINRYAPDFNASADHGEKTLLRYVNMVTMAALESASSPDPERSQSEITQYIRNVNEMLLKGDLVRFT